MGDAFSLVCGALLIVPGGAPTLGPPNPTPGQVEIAPAPRVSGLPVAIVAVKDGYRIVLNRTAAERLQQLLDQTDEAKLAASLRERAKQTKATATPDDTTAATLEVVAFLVANQLPGFRKALRENTGPGGATITLTGLQAPTVKFRNPRPRLERAVETVRGAMPLMPEDARQVVEALRAVARTTPFRWVIEPRQ